MCSLLWECAGLPVGGRGAPEETTALLAPSLTEMCCLCTVTGCCSVWRFGVQPLLHQPPGTQAACGMLGRVWAAPPTPAGGPAGSCGSIPGPSSPLRPALYPGQGVAAGTCRCGCRGAFPVAAIPCPWCQDLTSSFWGLWLQPPPLDLQRAGPGNPPGERCPSLPQACWSQLLYLWYLLLSVGSCCSCS